MKRSFSFVVALFLSSMISFTVLADDLEIYTGSGSAAVTYNPNVLFIMDTSGSMGTKDDGIESRMQKVQNALRTALGNATNINAGLMRFSDYGGPILFPINGIDASISPELIVPVTAGSDDAFEVGGNVYRNDSQLELTNGTDTVWTGLRFQELNIPRGATITSAVIRFTSAGINTGVSQIRIFGESVGNSNTFDSTTNNISSRTKTGAVINWNADNSFPLTDEVIATPDISAVVQEIVNRGDWCGNNNMSFLLEGTSADVSSSRRAFSNEDGNSRAPQLIITYDDTTATGCVSERLIYQVDQQDENAEERSNGYQSTGSELTFDAGNNAYIGTRFKKIAVPQGATITNAYLEFTAYQNATSNGAQMTIRGAAEDDPKDFHPYKRYMLANIAKTAASVSWSNIPNWYRNNDYQSPPVTSIVQEIVNRPGWQPNNDMMFVMSNFSYAKRGAYSYNGKPSGAVRLVIEYEGNATPGTTSTVRQHLIGKVDELSANGYTPIVDTLYEATMYYGGRDVYYGRKRGESSTSYSVRRATRVSHRSSYIGADSVRPTGCTDDNLNSNDCVNEYIPAGATYISPIQDLQCQVNNHIVLLSDGEANNNHSVSEIEALLGESCSGSGGEKCGLDLVRNIADAGESVIDARIITHTIGFAANATANNFLNQIALQSGGGFYTASDSAALLEAFETILRQVKDVNTTFVSPGVAVNQLNRLTHRDELYFALFKPSEGTVWPGNLKKYRIEGDVVKDKNNLNAVDSGTGFFSENSHSFWSPLADGNDVRQGGAISRLDLVRNVYTFGDSAGTIFTTLNKVEEGNTTITAEDLAVDTLPDSATLRSEVLKWARGVDVHDEDNDGLTTDINMMMGDPIHSQPIIVNYSANDSAIFVATNHGFLHSFDAATGEENFAIIPRELLANLYDFYRDSSSFTHLYGLDGDMVLRHFDDKVWLYIGQRRGGNNYYVFDVTEKLNPKFVYKIDGGVGDFANLGQTWSRPIITKINIGGTVKDVMIIGGGYDENQDAKAVRSDDTIGNSVFIVDANNGDLLWSASNAAATLTLPHMEYSIPARIAVIDRDFDGLADHLYAADMGGQLFRFDIYNGESTTDLVKGGLVAQLGGDSAEENRRFYYAPDVSEISLGDERYYAVALGSGFRAGPLNSTIQDYFFMIKDEGVYQQDEYGKFVFPSTPYVVDDLYDATAHLLTSSDETERDLAASTFASKNGWRIKLSSGGEKVLSSPLIIDYKVFFTTYLPASASDSLCAPPTGNSRAYLVNLFNANSVTDLNQNGVEEHQDRSAQLAQTGIAPDTKILIENIIKPVVCLGAECVSAVITVDEDGNEEACGTAFECLAQNIYGRFERVQKDTWQTEVENQ
ncbi:PilC/PilY family type IV pilus protein [Glaciecola sp. 1036]|uniref:PilC/PilY family type IV pilus protein n=1 Tax=Alteromonadaceae TaxID=72275 RepID=UPI003CFC706B